MIKEGKVRHIRLLGQGNIAFLIPYTNPDGTIEDLRFDVGEPYRAKKFRSVIYEVVLIRYAFYNRLSWLATESGIKIPVFQTVNYFMYYFHENEVNQDDREKLQSLQEKLLTECMERADLIETFLGNLILTVFDRGHFGKGINWKDVTQPFMPGFSDDNPIWQPEATTTFDPKLFVQKGGWPYGRKKKHPTKPICRAEEAIYEGRFEDAIKIYENILRYGHKCNRDFDSYIHHNLASLYLVLRQDKKAKTHFDLKAFL